ncbi:PglL family O-oligosaccharyltransferase [Acinetobacter towneri]|uniref:PglL family O-oligosaccharyltransferase n=1 Tax=Acinetobacter towneri TaxID=202956 RepID=UPI002096E716|nr:O-antigen ligase family protein [Acinetobacter towneri]MCO8059953.1 Wzy polymerase domain-containing protein [Acinetobacter towneri]MCO8065601.1 Wzy polymerase domain-containing protein [Acinetobacter towneri]
MKFFLLLLASIFISLAWLLPIHYRPWVTYTGELYAFFALFALAAIFLKEKLTLPKISLPLLALAAVPFIQWACGLLFFFDKALFSSLYIFGFWLAIVLGYNLTLDAAQREKIFTGLSLVFLGVGTLTGLMAICQWLTIDQYFPFIVDIRTGQRPYANFAQPNNMATFLVMSLMACLYLYEKQKLKTMWIVIVAAMILVGVVLSQSRTSWLASLCILTYLGYQQYRGVMRIKWHYSLLWFAAFIGLIFITPAFSQLLSQSADLSVQSRDVVQRATGDMSRLAIWQQMLAAIEHQPWWGYGWHQTSVAYVTISEFVQGPVWIRSAHNFILDFLLWNGVILGVPFLAYLGYWGYQLHKYTQSVESVVGILMLGAFSVHAMLEFPQNYAYFLLPAGFIIGMVQSQRVFKSFTLSIIYLRSTFVLGALLLMLIYRDYEVMVPKLNQSVRYEHTPEKITHQERILVLEEFNRRIAWIRLNPYSLQTPEQLQDIHEIVLNYPTRYDLLKYARVLAFNGYEAEAKKQLWLLSTLWQVNVDYATLLDEAKPR